MDIYTFSTLTDLLYEIKEYKKYENLEQIKVLLNNKIPSIKCAGVSVNDSPIASSFYGIIVFPRLIIRNGSANIEQYAIEIQKQAIDLFEPSQLAALIIHDISHNVLSQTVFERMKLSIIKACRVTNMKIVDVYYNMNREIIDLACLDISNRTFKDKVVPDTDMYEPDRVLVDMKIWEHFNSAVDKMASVDYLNLSDPDSHEISDAHIGLKIVKMVREKLRNANRTYSQLMDYIKGQYDTKIFEAFPIIYIKPVEDRLGAEVLDSEELKPFEHRALQEGVVEGILKHSQSESAKIMVESVFRSGKISYSALQKELDILNFKISSVSSNYERLAILDRIYDNIFALEKYLEKEKNKKDKIIWDYLNKFIEMTAILKDARVSKRKYGVFVEVPPGYEG